MYGKKFLSVLAGVVFASQLSSAAIAHSLDKLEKRLDEREVFVEMADRPAPTFTLRDPDGRQVRLEDYRGKVVVLWFIYTFCPDVCPLHSDMIATDIQEQINLTTQDERDATDALIHIHRIFGNPADPFNEQNIERHRARIAVIIAPWSQDHPAAAKRIMDSYTNAITGEGKEAFLMRRYLNLILDGADLGRGQLAPQVAAPQETQ